MHDEDARCKNRIQNEEPSNEETRHQEAEGRLDLQGKRKTHLNGFSVYTAIQLFVLQTVSPFRDFQKN